MDDRIRAQLIRGREYYRAGDYGQAEKLLSELAQAHHPFADVYDMLGVIYHQAGKLEDAEAMFEEALRLNPNYTEAALNLAVTYNDQGKSAAAQDVYDRVLSGRDAAPRTGTSVVDPLIKGKIANMHAEVAHAYQEAGLFDQAAEEFRKALGLCPQFHDLRTQYALALRAAGQAAQAQTELEAVKQDNPRYIPGRLHLGLSYLAADRRDDAEKEWQDVLAIDPDNQMARLYLTTLLR